MSYQMDQQMKRGNANAGPPAGVKDYGSGVSMPENLPERFFSKDEDSGEMELDMRKMTGPEALKFLRMQGIPVFAPPSVIKDE